MLFVSRFIQGAGGGIAGVAQAYVGDVVPPEGRAKAIGWLSAAAGTLCFTNVLFAWRWLPESSGASARDRPSRSIATLVWETLRRPGSDVSRLVWIYSIGMLGFMSSTAVTALYLAAQFGVTERTIGIFFLYIGGLSLLMRGVLLGPLLERFGEVGVLRIGAVTLAIGLASTPLAPTVPALLPLLALWPIGTACLFPATSALVTRWAATEERGQTLGLQQAFGGVARVAAPIWATFVFQAVGPGTPFLISGVIVAVAAVVAIGLRQPQVAQFAEEPT